MFNHKGYDLEVRADIDEDILVGKVYGIKSHILCYGKTLTELKRNFCDEIDAYLERCEEKGKEAEKPFSGKLPFRTDPDTHRKMFLAASQKKQSINAWLEDLVKNHGLKQDELEDEWDNFLEKHYYIDSDPRFLKKLLDKR